MTEVHTSALPIPKPATKAASKPAAKKAPKAAAIPAEPTVPPPPVAKPAPASSTTGADNLHLLKGVVPKPAVLLNGLVVTSFRQIADWTAADVARLAAELGPFPGPITRDNIDDHAALPPTHHKPRLSDKKRPP